MKKWTILPISLFAAFCLNAQEAPKKVKLINSIPVSNTQEFKNHVIRSLKEYETKQEVKQTQPVALDRKKYPTIDADHRLTK